MGIAETEPAGIGPQALAEPDAVMRRIGDGAAVDPETCGQVYGTVLMIRSPAVAKDLTAGSPPKEVKDDHGRKE